MYTDIMDHPYEHTSYGKLFFTLVGKTTHLRLDGVIMNIFWVLDVLYFSVMWVATWDSIESTEYSRWLMVENTRLRVGNVTCSKSNHLSIWEVTPGWHTSKMLHVWGDSQIMQCRILQGPGDIKNVV